MKASLKLAVLACLVSALPCAATPITGFATFDSTPLGIFGNWTIQLTSGDPAVQITEVKITLNSNTLFDSVAGGFGFPNGNTFEGFNSLLGTGGLVGLVGNNAVNNPADGTGTLDLHFSNFTSSTGFFAFGADVDKNNPLANCSGLRPLLALACNLGNGIIATANSLVFGGEFAGAQIQVFLGGPGVIPTSTTATFTQTGATTDEADFAADAIVVPEPATVWTLGAGLALVAFFGRRSWRRQ